MRDLLHRHCQALTNMFSASHYLALSFALLPFSAAVACGLLSLWDEHRHWNSGNQRRPKDWLRQGRTASLQLRTRR